MVRGSGSAGTCPTDQLFHAVKDMLDFLDNHIEVNGGITSPADHIDICDCIFLYFLAALNVCGDVARFSHIQDYLQQRLSHPAVKAAGVFDDNEIQNFMQNVVPARRALIKKS